MTNEEKAIELVKQFQSCINNGVSIDAAVMACLMEMAEWKDKQYRPIFDDLHEKLKDSVVINNSFGNIINLIKENSLTVDEITDIVNRFNKVKTIEEVKSLYDTISSELKKSNEEHNSAMEMAEWKNNMRYRIIAKIKFYLFFSKKKHIIKKKKHAKRIRIL